MNQVIKTASSDAASGAVTRSNHISPRLLTAHQAAAYVGYKSTEVLKRIPVRPVVLADGKASANRWDRSAIDRWIDGLSGVQPNVTPVEVDLEAEYAAWEARNGH